MKTCIKPDTELKLWWTADSQEEAEQWKTDCEKNGDTVEFLPRESTGQIDVFVNTTVGKALHTYDYDVASLLESYEELQEYPNAEVNLKYIKKFVKIN